MHGRFRLVSMSVLVTTRVSMSAFAPARVSTSVSMPWCVFMSTTQVFTPGITTTPVTPIPSINNRGRVYTPVASFLWTWSSGCTSWNRVCTSRVWRRRRRVLARPEEGVGQ